ncbi:MFS transporter [Paracidovorax avenae]|uniref:MFS transporter n=1 Tax=Paracidovorax avenae TaxID=80867 RepID=UPI000D2076CD|nr:MFS transporter [Paracidovorax avenae]AVT12078.1 MFS transporter [Paracidovorax avenae]
MTCIKQEIRPVALLSALGVGSLALLTLGLQPILLGELLEAGRLGLDGLGAVAMAEIVALALGVLLGDQMLSLRLLPLATAGAALAAAALDWGTLHASGVPGFALVRGAAGLAEGILVWGTTAVIVRSAQPDRIAGAFFVTQTVAQALVGLLLAHVVIPAHGWQGAFGLLAALLLLPALLAPALPRSLQPLPVADNGGFAWTPARTVPLLGAFLQLSTLGALWAYVEPLGRDAGLSATAVQTLVAACLGIQVVGGSCGSALVRTVGAPAVLLPASLLLGAVALSVPATAGGGATAFVLLCGLFAFLWLFITPFQMRLAFDVDPSGRVASLVPAAQLFGIACGPLVASFFVEGEQAQAVPLVSAAFGAAAVLVLALGAAARRRVLAG